MFLIITVSIYFQVATSFRIAGKRRESSIDGESSMDGEPVVNNVIDFADRNANMASKLKAVKTEQYKKMWPLTCTGENTLGEKVFDSFADGFRCMPSNQDKIAQAIAPPWYSEKADFICCKGKCENALYSNCGALDLSQAALRMVEAVSNVEVGGEEIVIEHSVVNDEDNAAGILQQLAIHIPENFVSFVHKKPILTAEGKDNLHTLADKVVSVLSMLSTANSGSKLLACPHGATTACLRESDGRGKRCNTIGRRLHKLPYQRAALVAEELRSKLNGIEVGEAFGHFKYEKQSDFEGGRYGAVIIKAYDGSLSAPPPCKFDDLYDFVRQNTSASEE